MAGLLAMLPAAEGFAQGGPGGGPPGSPAPGSLQEAPDAVPGEVVVRYRPGTPGSARRAARARVGAAGIERSTIARMEVIRLGPGEDRDAAIAELSRRPDVLYAEPNHVVRTLAPVIPNDPGFEFQWGLHNTGQANGRPDADIDAPEAWAITRGDGAVRVAVVDTGIDAEHPDLQGNVLPDGKDWVDDGTANHLTDPNGHGTHVAGIIGAVGDNGVGVAGVAWEVGLMSLRVLDPDGSGSTADVAEAFNHAGENAVPIVNASLGWRQWSQAVHDAITEQPGTLFVVAAGNASGNNDRDPTYPCAFRLPNVLCVTATNRWDGRASFSNIGPRTVHLGAPGRDILSTWTGSAYAWSTGTSMAAPHATGVAALVRSEHPDASAAQVREALLRSVDPLRSIDQTVAAGRLNAAVALRAADRLTEAGVATTGALLSSKVGPQPRPRLQRGRRVRVQWDGAATHDVRRRVARVRGRFGPRRLWVVDRPRTQRSFRAALGRTYCFQSRTRASGGVTSPWSGERCTAVPLNDRSLVRRGSWARRTGRNGLFLRSFSESDRRGSRLILRRIRGAERVAVIVTRCPGCGAVDVLWKGRHVRRVGLRAPSVRKKRFVRLPVQGNGKLVIRVASRGRPVRIEGLAISRA